MTVKLPQTANVHRLGRYVQVLGEKDTLRVEIEIREVNLEKETRKKIMNQLLDQTYYCLI